MRVFSHTYIGQRKSQQDNFRLDREDGFFVVCDGVGGTDDGNIASQFISDYLFNHRHELISTYKMKKSVIDASKSLKHFMQSQNDVNKTGTTLAMVKQNHLSKYYLVTIGDTRVYLFYPSKSSFWHSKDHSLVQEMIDEKLLEYDKNQKNHPMRNFITKSINSSQDMDFDDVVVQEVDVDKKDTCMIICTDGVWEILDENFILKQFSCQPTDHVFELIKTEVHLKARDNATFIIIDFRPDFTKSL